MNDISFDNKDDLRNIGSTASSTADGPIQPERIEWTCRAEWARTDRLTCVRRVFCLAINLTLRKDATNLFLNPINTRDGNNVG